MNNKIQPQIRRFHKQIASGWIQRQSFATNENKIRKRKFQTSNPITANESMETWLQGVTVVITHRRVLHKHISIPFRLIDIKQKISDLERIFTGCCFIIYYLILWFITIVMNKFILFMWGSVMGRDGGAKLRSN